MMTTLKSLAPLVAIQLFLATPAISQKPSASPTPAVKLASVGTMTPPAPAPTERPAARVLSRWIDLQTLSFQARYRRIETSKGLVSSNQLQSSEGVKTALKLDRNGKWSIQTGVYSGGEKFTGGWNDTGVGTGNLKSGVYLKQLYGAAKPWAGVELQLGGLGILRGESTEITSYDNDGYVVGERVSIKHPKELYFDEISYSRAYLGDLTSPSVFGRLHRLGDAANYQQVLLGKGFGKRARVSFDYTVQSGIDTARAGIKLATKELRFTDSVRLELYHRIDQGPASGFALQGEKAVGKRWSFGAGFASVDPGYGGLNGDRYNKGKRLFGSVSYALTPELKLQAWSTRAVDNSYALSNRSRVDVVLVYDALKTLQRVGLIR